MIESIGSGSGVSYTTTSSASQVMGKDDFLQLLVTQLSHQDPMNPMDGQEFAAQLAQFSSLEQLSNMNTSLSESLDNDVVLAQSIANNLAVGLIGREVLTLGDHLSPDDENIHFQLASPAASVQVDVLNPQGQLVRTLEAGAMSEGTQSLSWDGRDSDGNLLPDGDYTFTITARDSTGEAVSSLAVQRSRVDGISYIDGQAWLSTGEGVVALGDVVEVLESDDQTESETSGDLFNQ